MKKLHEIGEGSNLNNFQQMLSEKKIPKLYSSGLPEKKEVF